VRISLNLGKYATINKVDYYIVCPFKWFAKRSKNGTWYAQANVRFESGARGTIFMHRLIAGSPKGKEVDHRNHDGLDNRRRNLRICTGTQNRRNRRPSTGKRFKGVYYAADRSGWRANIKIDGKTRSLGVFDSEVKAARAYDKVAMKVQGGFSCLNFP